MRIILKPLFEILTGEVAVCDNLLFNYVVMLGIGEVAFWLARSLVGDAYCSGMISGKSAGSILHWLFRLVIYVGIAYLLRAAIAIYFFIVSIPEWVWFVLLGLLIFGIVSLIYVNFYRQRGSTA